MDVHAVSEDRVVNINETSCLLPVHQIGWGWRDVTKAQLQGNAMEAMTFTVAFSMDRGPVDMLVQIVQAGQTPSCRSSPGWSALTTTRPGKAWATTTKLLQLTATLDNVLNQSSGSFSGTWPASTPAHPGRHAGDVASRRAALHPTTNHVVLAALRHGRLPQLQTPASTTLARSVIDGSFEGLAMNKAWRRQYSSEWVARALMVFCNISQVWTTGWPRLRSHANAEFREAAQEANELHATGALFARQIEPEPAPEDTVDWAMAESSDE